MVFYRVGHEFFLCYNQSQIIKVYDGEFGIPNNFYLHVGTVEDRYTDLIAIYGLNVYFLMMIFDGVILTNVGSIDKVKEGKWIRYEVGPGDLVDYQIRSGSIDMRSPCLAAHFMYSDQTKLSIIHFEDKVLMYDREYIEFNDVDPVLPLITTYAGGYSGINFTFMDSSPDRRCYSTNLDLDGKIYDPFVWIPLKLSGKLIEVKHNGNKLYSDGTLRGDGFTFSNILKIANNDNIFLTLEGILMNKNSVILAEGVTNFYISNFDNVIYILKEGKLWFRPFNAEPNDELTLVLDDAKDIKFQIESSYDLKLNNPSKMKSSRK